MSNDLKPVRCGCGGEANVYSWNEEDDGVQSIHYHTICMKCGIETNAYETEAEAITAWNRAMGATDTNVDDKFEYHIDHTDCIWYWNGKSRCPSTCSQYRDGWNDAMNFIFKGGKGYSPYRRGEHE